MSKNSELERQIIAALIMRPALIDASDLISTRTFSTETYRRVFAAVAAAMENGRPEIMDEVLLAEAAGIPVADVSKITLGCYAPVPENFALWVSRFLQQRWGEQILQMSRSESEAFVKTGEIDPARLREIREAWREVEELETGTRAKKNLWEQGRTFAELQQLEIKVDWVVDQLIPERAITLIHAPGGTGKTWVGLDLARAVSTGTPFLGIPTQRRPVLYVDYEMPLALMRERTVGLNIQEGRLWNISDDPRPPRLDSDDWDIFLQAKDAVAIFDSLRSAHSKPGNDDEVAAFVMDRVKQIRQHGASPVLIHHTPRANERTSKGSTAWTDLSDHVLSLHRVQPKTFRPIEDDGVPDPNATYYFGTGEKSRYSPFHLYLRRGPTGALELAQDPSRLVLDAIHAFLVAKPGGATQTEVAKWAKEDLNITSKGTLVSLLKKGETTLWTSSISGTSRYYVAL